MTISFHSTWWWLYGALIVIYAVPVLLGFAMLSFGDDGFRWRNGIIVLLWPLYFPLRLLAAIFFHPW